MEDELQRQIERLTLQLQETQKRADEETRRRQEAEQREKDKEAKLTEAQQQQQQTQQQLQQTQQELQQTQQQLGEVGKDSQRSPLSSFPSFLPLGMLNPFPSFHSQVNSGPWPPTNEKQALWLRVHHLDPR